MFNSHLLRSKILATSIEVEGAADDEGLEHMLVSANQSNRQETYSASGAVVACESGTVLVTVPPEM